MLAKLVAAEEDQRMLVLVFKLRTHTMIHNKELNNSKYIYIYTFYIYQPTCTHPSFHHTTVNLHHHVRPPTAKLAIPRNCQWYLHQTLTRPNPSSPTSFVLQTVESFEVGAKHGGQKM